MILVCCWAVNKYSKFTDLLLKFSKRARKLRFNQTKTDTEIASNWVYFGIELRNESKCTKKVLFRVSLQNPDFYFNP